MTTTMPSRRSNWPEKLTLFLMEKRQQPFDWATNNCAFFACDWIAILTGFDPARPFRRCVKSALSAERAFASEGGVEGIATRICVEQGWPECPVSHARRGDVAVVDTEHGPALGVVVGSQTAHAGPHGIVYLPLAGARRAWRIG